MCLEQKLVVKEKKTSAENTSDNQAQKGETLSYVTESVCVREDVWRCYYQRIDQTKIETSKQARKSHNHFGEEHLNGAMYALSNESGEFLVYAAAFSGGLRIVIAAFVLLRFELLFNLILLRLTEEEKEEKNDWRECHKIHPLCPLPWLHCNHRVRHQRS